MDHIYTQAADWDSRDELGYTGSRGYLTKFNPWRPVGKKVTAIHHTGGHPSPELFDAKQPL